MKFALSARALAAFIAAGPAIPLNGIIMPLPKSGLKIFRRAIPAVGIGAE